MVKRAVLVGAGHCHLHTLHRARRFAEAGHELVCIAPDRFWYSGLATGVLGGLYPPELDQIDVGRLLAASGGRFVADRAVRIDPAAREVETETGEVVRYDALSLDLGSVPPDLPSDGSPGVFGVKPVANLWRLRQALEARFAADPDRPVRVLVAGAGPTGCEIAANVEGLAAARGGRVSVVLLAGGAILRGLPAGAAARVVRELERRGVAVRRGARVVRIEAGSAVPDRGEPEPFDLMVNATGLKPHPLLGTLGLPVDGDGALVLDRHLRSPADPAVHGGGDGVTLEGRALPRIGVHAIRQGPVLLHNLLAALDGTAPRTFEPQERYLWILNLGDGTGLAARGGLWWHGRSAFLLKDWIDRRFLRAHAA